MKNLSIYMLSALMLVVVGCGGKKSSSSSSKSDLVKQCEKFKKNVTNVQKELMSFSDDSVFRTLVINLGSSNDWIGTQVPDLYEVQTGKAFKKSNEEEFSLEDLNCKKLTVVSEGDSTMKVIKASKNSITYEFAQSSEDDLRVHAVIELTYSKVAKGEYTLGFQLTNKIEYLSDGRVSYTDEIDEGAIVKILVSDTAPSVEKVNANVLSQYQKLMTLPSEVTEILSEIAAHEEGGVIPESMGMEVSVENLKKIQKEIEARNRSLESLEDE